MVAPLLAAVRWDRGTFYLKPTLQFTISATIQAKQGWFAQVMRKLRRMAIIFQEKITRDARLARRGEE